MAFLGKRRNGGRDQSYSVTHAGNISLMHRLSVAQYLIHPSETN